MPRGPKGQKRPADVVSNAVRVMEIATGQRGEEFEGDQGKDQAAAELGRRGGRARGEDDNSRALGRREEGRGAALAYIAQHVRVVSARRFCVLVDGAFIQRA